MTAKFRPRRSVLYMPGSNTRAMEKARELPADCVIFDLEDAVAPEAKEQARGQVKAAIQAGGYGRREVVVRVNGLDTQWAEADIRALAASGADALLLPKVESADTIKRAARIMSGAGAPADMPIWIMTETPRGVLELENIVSNQPRLSVIVMGTSDLAQEMRVEPNGDRAGLMHALGHCVLTARSYGLDIIDGVQLILDDAASLRTACEQGRALGFDGKSLIHPRQIETANELFGVSAAEVSNAREIIAAWEQARSEGKGITVLDGVLIEEMHRVEAERILALHAAAN